FNLACTIVNTQRPKVARAVPSAQMAHRPRSSSLLVLVLDCPQQHHRKGGRAVLDPESFRDSAPLLYRFANSDFEAACAPATVCAADDLRRSPNSAIDPVQIPGNEPHCSHLSAAIVF